MTESCESRDEVNNPLESAPDAGGSEERFQSLESGDKWYIEHFQFDAGFTVAS